MKNLETLLIQWFQQVKLENVPINGPVLWEKSNVLALTLKTDNSEDSNAWLDRFKKRHSIQWSSHVRFFLI
jgi:hypothetical protein